MENNIRTWAKLTAIDETLYFAWWNYRIITPIETKTIASTMNEIKLYIQLIELIKLCCSMYVFPVICSCNIHPYSKFGNIKKHYIKVYNYNY